MSITETLFFTRKQLLCLLTMFRSPRFKHAFTLPGTSVSEVKSKTYSSQLKN